MKWVGIWHTGLIPSQASSPSITALVYPALFNPQTPPPCVALPALVDVRGLLTWPFGSPAWWRLLYNTCTALEMLGVGVGLGH